MGDEWGSQIGPDDEGPCQKVKDLETCLKTRLMLSSKYFWNSCSEPSNAPFAPPPGPLDCLMIQQMKLMPSCLKWIRG